MATQLAHPLFHEGWIAFNNEKWNAQPLILTYGERESDGTYAEMVVYREGNGGVFIPPRNPYLPTDIRTTSTSRPESLARQHLEATDSLAKQMSSIELRTPVNLSPNVQDIRSWLWNQFDVRVRYTYYIPLPFDISRASSAVRRHIKKARRKNYHCERTSNFEHIATCLSSTEQRQGFQLGFSTDDYRRLQELMGEEYCRTYICYSENGEPASARVILHSPGAPAVDWLVGTATEHLSSGCTHLLLSYVLDDLERADASEFDYEGANIPNVAASKAEWGSELRPFYRVSQHDWRSVAREGRILAGKMFKNVKFLPR